MPKSYKKKPLGEWPDNKKHAETQPLEDKDSETAFGHEPASGSDEVSSVDEITKEMGIYEEDTNSPGSGPENPDEVNIAEEIEKNREG